MKLPTLVSLSLIGMLTVAGLLAVFSPLSVKTDGGEDYQLDFAQIERIVLVEDGKTFYIEETSGKTIFTQESFSFFKTRAAFHVTQPLAGIVETDGQFVFGSTSLALSSDGQCDPKVDGYNVYQVQGFIYIDPTTFIVIDENRAFGDCPCDDPAVRRGRNANCPHVHHRTKKKIVDRARSCGLGDWFPVRRCQ